MLESGVPYYQITALTTIKIISIYRIRDNAIKRGYNPVVSKLLVLAYIANEPKLGRPSILIADIV
jgi:hypothetical protein